MFLLVNSVTELALLDERFRTNKTTTIIMIITGNPTPKPIPSPIANPLFLFEVGAVGDCDRHDSYTVTGPMLVKFEPRVPVPQKASNYYSWVKVSVSDVAPETVSPLDKVLPVLDLRTTLVITCVV
jgi:hypothetical protein